jgi:hypothetical protein
MDGITVYLKPTKALRRRLLANHLMPGLVLVVNGVDALLGGERKSPALIFLNFFAGGLLFATVIYEMKKAGSQEHKAVGWVEIFAGAVLVVEGVNHFHPNKGFQPAVLYWAVGLATVLMGVFHSRVSRLRRAVLDETGSLIRTSPFHKLQMRWESVSSIDFDDSRMKVASKDGRVRKISLRMVENRAEVEVTFKGHAARNGIGEG